MFLKRCSSPVLSGAELLGCPEEGPAGGSKGTSWPVAPICTPGRSGDSAILVASRFLDDGDGGAAPDGQLVSPQPPGHGHAKGAAPGGLNTFLLLPLFIAKHPDLPWSHHGTRFGADRAELGTRSRTEKKCLGTCSSVQWNTSKFSEHVNGYSRRQDIDGDEASPSSHTPPFSHRVA